MPEELARKLLAELNGWQLDPGMKLVREYKFKDFAEPLAFVNRVAALAEAEGHHPDFQLRWGYVRLELFTHKIAGLTESDFILAAKIDRIH